MSEQYDFDEIVDRSQTNSNKWDKYSGRDILPMWVADTDFRVALAIQQALHKRSDHPVFGYSNPPQRLVELVIERMQRLYGWQVDPAWLVWLPGVVGGLHLACRSNGKSGDAVYTPAVIYPRFTQAPELSARVNRAIPMARRRQRMILDLDWLEQQRPQPRQVLLFCNPQNPGGAVYRDSELRRLADIAERQDLILCSDEIHCDLVLDRDKKHIPLASLDSVVEQRCITLMAPSKTFNIAGLGCSFAIIANPELRRRFKRAGSGILPYVNILGYAAAEAAYECGDEWNRQQCRYLAANRDYLVAEINRIPGLQLDPIESTFLAWINISQLGLDNPMAFFERAGLGLSSGQSFGDSDYMRLNFGCPRSRLIDAIERLRRALEA